MKFFGKILKKPRDLKEEITNSFATARRAFRDFQSLGVSPKRFFVSLIFASISSFLEILQFGLIYKLVDALIQRNPQMILYGPSGFWLRFIMPDSIEGTSWIWAYLIGMTLVVKSAEIVINFKSQRFLFESQRFIQSHLNEKIFERSVRVGFSFFDLYPLRGHTTWADISPIISQKTENYSDQLKATFSFIMGVMNLGVFILGLAYLNFFLLCIGIAINPFVRYFAGRCGKLAQIVFRRKSDEVGLRVHRTESVIRSISVVKAANMEQEEIGEFVEANSKLLAENMRGLKEEVIQRPVNEISKLISTAVIGILTPFFSRLSGASNLSSTFVGIMMIRQIENQLDIIKNSMKTLAHYDGIKKSIDVITGDDILKHYITEGGLKVSDFENSIELRRLDFGYLPDKKILSDVNIAFKAGTVTAIVGTTGSGKSTLTKILLRFSNVKEGSYFIDGVDVSRLETASVRDLFAVVSQETRWMNRTILENLTYGLQRIVPADEVRETCRRTKILDFVESLPLGFDTPLTPDGSPLSGGQQQCLSIARAILKKAPILILDEPTSALDAITEAEILTLLTEVMQGLTVITIAHRLSTIYGADRVILLNGGRVEESGTIEELVNLRGGFYKLWEKQGRFWRETKAS
jgi:ABC-type multidrug transport system fused ATPase/permease subunit